MKRKRASIAFLLFSLVFLVIVSSAAMESESYRIPTFVFSGGGVPMSSPSYDMNSILGQSSPLMDPNDPPTSPTYSLNPGFWNTLAAVQPPAVSLQFTLEPAGARDAGAQWRVDNGAWQNSGAMVSGLGFGDHEVEYKAVTGWTAPASPEIVAVTGNPTAITRTYTATTAGCTVWPDVISKYQAYVNSQGAWTEVIECYQQYVSNQ
jgi:hypothetical protein